VAVLVSFYGKTETVCFKPEAATEMVSEETKLAELWLYGTKVYK
jgi:hypothetical protein